MELAPEFLHYALLKVRQQVETRHQTHGICGALDAAIWSARHNPGLSTVERLDLVFAAQADLEELFTRWPEFSGYISYPIPAPKSSGLTPHEAFGYATDLWDPECEYGAARRRLLDWLIAETSPKREASAGTQV